MQNLSIVFLAVSSLALAVSGQSCGIEGTNATTFELLPVTESTPGDVLIARFQTFGLDSTTAVSSPHYKYIRALRYTNGVYEFLTEAIFPDFIAVERSDVIERSVNFKCADGSSRRFTFLIPVIDKNSAPTFNAVSSVNVTLPLNETPITVATGIIATDRDLEANADVYITSSNKRLAPVVTPLFSGSNPAVYNYQVDFQVSSDISVGQHQTLLTADDGQSRVSKLVTVTVSKAPVPTTTTTTTTTTTKPTTTTEEVPIPEPTASA